MSGSRGRSGKVKERQLPIRFARGVRSGNSQSSLMPVEISVGPPVLTISHGSTFMVTDLNGQIAPRTEQGVYAGDTRLLSHYALFANGKAWVRLSSSTISYFAARIYLTNPRITTETGDIREGTLALTVSRAVGESIHEDLDLTNYGLHAVRFMLEIALGSDFADLFEVRQHKFVRRGRIDTVWERQQHELQVSYSHRDFRRCIIYRVRKCRTTPEYANGRVSFEVEIPAGGAWHVCGDYVLQDDRVQQPMRNCEQIILGSDLDERQERWLNRATRVRTSNEDLYRFYRQSLEDMGALRLYEHDLGPDLWLSAAGVPWFVTLFGRDSLIVSLQNMLVDPTFALGALRMLARFQATERDDWRDAEPGKILHELRSGELAYFGKIPHTPYYGTADATSLYLVVLHEAWKWLGDAALLREHRHVALRCLKWIDESGDLDQDGFQEYQTRSSLGYENVGWKDAGDAVVYPDGSQVKQPKALCELQGYVFDAWSRMAEVFDVLGEPDRAVALRCKAADLQRRFEAAFWCDDTGYYAFGLDPQKQPIKTIASNAGHCLWSGIASAEHAGRVVQRLLQPDMWSGWGIRTLSANNPAYNPFSYQLGSVWPHDNGIIALGFKRYGFAAEAARVARDVSEAASHFVSYRLPELYAGIERRAGTFPVQYPGANVPQAWAAGSVFHLLRAILGVQADAPTGRLYVDPVLPRWLPDVTLSGLKVGQSAIDLRFWREGEHTRWDVLAQRGTADIVVVQQGAHADVRD